MPACPACTGSRVRSAPASRATGRSILRCLDCGVHFSSELEKIGHEEGTRVIPLTEVSADDYRDWVEIKRPESGPDSWAEAARWILESLGNRDRTPRLYDVGAGAGDFLQVARDEYGFEVRGNDIVEGAVELAKARYDVTLDLGDLTTLAHREEFDAVTMWCVLAHVPDGDQLLADVFAMLNPGGVVFLQTPRWSAADTAGHAVQRLTRGRVSKLPDRRVAEHHRILHTEQSITAQLERIGFVDVETRAQLRFPLTSRAYLASMDPPPWTLGPAAWLMDRMIASPVAPRIVLDVRARKP